MENEILEQPQIEGKWVVITSKFNCQDFPLGTYETYTTINEDGVEETYEEFVPLPHLIFATQEDLDQIGKTKCFDMDNNRVIDYDNTEDLNKQHLDELRAKRVPLLKAFDVYKSNVNYGVEFEGEEERQLIIEWYTAIKDLNENAINNVPEKIKYYL